MEQTEESLGNYLGAPQESIADNNQDETERETSNGLNGNLKASSAENGIQSVSNSDVSDTTGHYTNISTADVHAIDPATSETEEKSEALNTTETVEVEIKSKDASENPGKTDPVAFSTIMNGDDAGKVPTPVEEVDNPSASPSIELETRSKDGDIESNSSEPVSTTQLISPDEYNPSRDYPAVAMSVNVPTAPAYGAGAYPGGAAGGGGAYPGAGGRGAYPSGGGGGAYPYNQSPGYSPYQAQPPGGAASSSQAGYSSASTVPIMDMKDPVKPGQGGDGSGPSGSRAAATSSALREKEEEEQYSEMEASDVIMVGLAYMMLVLLFPLLIFNSFRVLNTFERAVIFRLGKIKTRTKPPTGVVFQLPCTDDVHVVDIRTRSVNVPAQEILTKDSVTCRVDGILFYEITDPIKSVTKVEDVTQSVALLAQTALRTVLGYRTLPEILAAKMAISHDIMEIVEERARNWGVQILRVDLKDMILAPQLQRALVAEAETARSAKAQVIRADGEHRAAEMLTKASEILNDSKVGVQLRYLQTLNQISGTNNKTVVLPLPPVLAERAIGGLVRSLAK